MRQWRWHRQGGRRPRKGRTACSYRSDGAPSGSASAISAESTYPLRRIRRRPPEAAMFDQPHGLKAAFLRDATVCGDSGDSSSSICSCTSSTVSCPIERRHCCTTIASEPSRSTTATEGGRAMIRPGVATTTLEPGSSCELPDVGIEVAFLIGPTVKPFRSRGGRRRQMTGSGIGSGSLGGLGSGGGSGSGPGMGDGVAWQDMHRILPARGARETACDDVG